MTYELAGILLTVVIQALYIAHRIGKFEEKLISLERKQDKHNNLMERTYHNEQAIAVLKEKIDVENHRIEDLEEIQNHCKNRVCS